MYAHELALPGTLPVFDQMQENKMQGVKQGGVSLFKVGGAIRDRLLRRSAHDVDFAVEAKDFQDMKDFIVAHGGQILVEKQEFVTLKAKIGGEVCDFVLCRKDGVYRDGRRPESVRVGTILDDLARRDFTMNAMAVPCIFKDGKIVEGDQIIDPYQGKLHLEQKVLHCVGNHKERLTEDALRIVRALRFCLTLHLQPDPDIVNFLQDDKTCGTLLSKVSTDRLSAEMEKCLVFSTKRSILLFARHRFVLDLFEDRLPLRLTTKKVRPTETTIL